MANRYATKSGNWSDVTVWDGGVSFPGAGDTVRPNGFTVTIDQNITVTELRNNASAPASSGGTFNLAVGWTITANIIGSAAGTPCVGYSGSGGTRYIVGNVTGDVGYGITVSSQDLLVITGNITCTNNYKALYGPGSINTAITGNVTAGTTSGANAIDCGGTNDIAVTGSVTSSVANAAINATGSGTISISGTVTASSAYAGIVSSSASCTIIANGDLIAGSNGKQPLYANGPLWISASATLSHAYPRNNAGTAGTLRYLYTGGTNLGQPTAANVRSGTTFGASSEYTGSLAVPSPTLVAIGVPTDNTVGSYAPSGGATAAEIADAVWDEARSGHTTSGTFGATSQWVSSGDTSGVTELLTRIPDAAPGAEGGLPVLSADLTVNAELDSASRLAIWNTLTTETFTADSFGELLLISDGTNGRAVKVTGANHIAADVHDCQTDGLSGSTEITAINTFAARVTTGLVQDGAVYQFTDNMLELAPAGGGGGGSGDATLAKQEEILAQLDVIQTKTDTIGSVGAITSLLAAAVLEPGTITSFPETLTIGDSYTEQNGREIQIPIVDTDGTPLSSTGSLNFADASVTFTLQRSGETDSTRVITGSATFVDPPGTGTGAGAPYAVIELPASETAKGLKKYKYSGILTFTWTYAGTGTADDVMSFETDTVTFDS